MSAHRRHYLDLNPPIPASPQPIEQVRLWSTEPRPDTANMIGIALAMFFIGLFAFSGLAAYYMHRGELGVRQKQVAAFEQPPISVEEARIEGFRAGMATAAAQGCPATTLSQPIATR